MKTWLTAYWRTTLAGFLLTGVLVGALTLLWRLVVLPFHGSTVSGNVTVGGLAVTGVLVTAAVSMVGLSLKQSIDRRTLELSQAEHRRQQMESAMQTVGLLTLANGETAPKPQISAALLVLAKLGEVSLAVDLAAEMWPKDQLSTSAAVRIINGALLGNDPPLQREAAALLRNNVRLLDVDVDQYEWPTCLDIWPMALDAEARGTVALAVTEWIKKRKPNHDSDFRLKLMHEALEQDPDGVVKKFAQSVISG